MRPVATTVVPLSRIMKIGIVFQPYVKTAAKKKHVSGQNGMKQVVATVAPPSATMKTGTEFPICARIV